MRGPMRQNRNILLLSVQIGLLSVIQLCLPGRHIPQVRVEGLYRGLLLQALSDQVQQDTVSQGRPAATSV